MYKRQSHIRDDDRSFVFGICSDSGHDPVTADGLRAVSYTHLDVYKRQDMGPGGGEQGGRIVACGTPEEIKAVKESVTGRYL